MPYSEREMAMAAGCCETKKAADERTVVSIT